MSKFKTLVSLPFIEFCNCDYCSRLKTSYILKFRNSDVYFYAWDSDDGSITIIYLSDCPYKNKWEMFFEVSFQEAFDLLDDEHKISILFNLDLFR